MARVRNNKKTNPLVLIKYEGSNSAEQVYFNNFKRRDLRIKYSTGNSTDIKGMLEDLIIYMNKEDINKENQDKIYLILDTDLKDKKIHELEDIKNKCLEYGIQIITSAPTFEIWYLMHYRKNNLTFSKSSDVKKSLKEYIPEYKETMNVYPHIMHKTHDAIATAKRCEEIGKQTGINEYKTNPHSDIYKVVEELLNM